MIEEASLVDPENTRALTWRDPAVLGFQTVVYLRFRRLIPFAIAHALMDGTSAFLGVLLPPLAT